MLLKFAVKEFIEEKELANLSPHSISSYNYTLEEFHNFCIKKEVLNAEDVTVGTIKQYLLYCKKERGNNPSSLNHKLKNLRALFNWLEQTDIIEPKKNPAKKVETIRVDIKIDPLTEAQIKQILGYYRKLKHKDKSFFAYRDSMIVIFLLGSGCRLGELVNLRWQDIDFENYTLTVFGKKRQYSSIPLTGKLKKELAEYRVFLQQIFKDQDLNYVFTSARNKQITHTAVKNVFQRLSKVMNFPVRLSAHTFRHTFAATMVRSGCDAFTLQRMLRHNSLEMTTRYVNLFGTALKEINDRHNPLNTLNL